ncbi:MAG: prepilin-type N-terminal cleavage/methylation domain-containing protein [Alphaproteobacteria bacterium]
MTKIFNLRGFSPKGFSPKGFSLIELSIVILIIGILVAGVTQSSRLISQMRLVSTRSITQGSSIPSIQGLVAWWECCDEKTFLENEANNNSLISTWNDLNPTSTSKSNLVQSNTLSQPTYISSSINNLPSLRFDGSDRFTTNNFFSETFSVFVVLRTSIAGNGNSSSQAYLGSAIIGADTPGTANDIIPLAIGGGFIKIFTGNSETTLTSPITVNDNKPYLIFSSRNIANGNRTLMINNSNLVSDNLGGTTPLNSNPQVGIGADSNLGATPFSGDISEVIVFNRILSTEERTSISQYLAKKYAIKL